MGSIKISQSRCHRDVRTSGLEVGEDARYERRCSDDGVKEQIVRVIRMSGRLVHFRLQSGDVGWVVASA